LRTDLKNGLSNEEAKVIKNKREFLRKIKRNTKNKKKKYFFSYEDFSRKKRKIIYFIMILEKKKIKI
jgi:hypothetical protein